MRLVLSTTIVVCAAFAPNVAQAETNQSQPLFKRGYIRVPGAAVKARTDGGPIYASSRKVYVNRCVGGCPVFFSNIDDSRTGASSIAEGSRVIPEFSQGDQVWNDMMTCVRETFAPFNIEVTDVQPPSTEPYFMNIVGGRATDLRSDLSGAGGVSPFDCGEIPNAITYTFDVYGPDTGSLCWTVAQEVAHAFGLDHEYLQKDPMTYLAGDIPKRFRDIDSVCGTFSEMPCTCGMPKQNSYRSIVAMFGPGLPTPPSIEVKNPTSGKKTQPGFSAQIKALDDVRVERVEIYIDGTLSGMAMTEIQNVFEIATPREVGQGQHELEVRAFDVQGVQNTTTVAFDQGPPCSRAGGCTGVDVCVEGICLPGPEAPGGLGAICTADTECLSHRCVDAGEPQKRCVEECTVGNAESCPDDFECAAAGATGVCWYTPSGCCQTGTGPTGPLVLGLGVMLLVLRRRRR